MLNNNPFYYGTIKKAIVAFGAMFSEMQIQRTNTDGTIAQTVNVPITYAGKEKWVVRMEGDPLLTNNTQTTLPRMSFEINGYSYDSTRKVNRMNVVSNTGTTTAKRQYSPVPYNVELSLYVLTKTTEDALTIVEQILPFFTPEFTLCINAIPDMNIANDIPVILNSVSVEDDYEGDFSTRRSIIHTFSFTMKLNIFGPISTVKIINTVDISPSFITTILN